MSLWSYSLMLAFYKDGHECCDIDGYKVWHGNGACQSRGDGVLLGLDKEEGESIKPAKVIYQHIK